MYCKNCGTKIEDDTAFCPECGKETGFVVEKEPEEVDEPKTVIYERTEEKETNTENTENTDGCQEAAEVIRDAAGTAVVPGSVISTDRVKYCPNCGTANAEQDEFCCACGTPFNDNVKKQGNKKIKWNYKYMVLGVCALLLIVFIVNGVVGKKAEPILYLKDNEINGVIKRDKTYVVGEDVYIDEDYITGPYNSIVWQVQFTPDNKYVFYPQDATEAGNYELYRRAYGKEKAEEVKVDSDISSYYVVDKESVFYIKGDRGNRLYYSNLKDKEKLASDVAWFRLSEDNKYILWKSNDGDNKLYVQDAGLKKEKMKIDSDVTEIEWISSDLEKIVYKKEDILYIVRNFEEKEKLASSVSNVNVFDNNGNIEIYYTVDKGKTEQLDVDAIVEDNYAEADAKMTEPDITQYQRTETKPSFWGPKETVITDEAYYTALDEYQKKLDRDYMRELLKEGMDVETCEVYYYSDVKKNSSQLWEGVVTNTYSSNPVAVYAVFETENIEPISISSLMELNESEIGEKITSVVMEGIKLYAYKGGKATEWNIDWEEYAEDSLAVYSNTEKKECYILLTERAGYEKYLYRIADTANGEMELLAEEVAKVELVTGEGIYYLTEQDGEVGELYLNDEKVDSDVKAGSCYKSDKGIVYITDPDEQAGSLYIYGNGNKEKISDDVADYRELEDGRIALLIDYNFSKYRGELKIYDKKKIIHIDSDVTSIIM